MIKQMRTLAVLAAMTQTVAMAQSLQVVVSYGPANIASVPTLSEWGLMIMGVVLAGVALHAIRKNASSKTIMSLALSAVVLLGTGLGNQTLQSAWAVLAPKMDNPAGGATSPFPQYIGIVPIQNTTTVPLRIISVTPVEVQNAPGTTCDPGVIVAPAASCNVDTGSTT